MVYFENAATEAAGEAISELSRFWSNIKAVFSENIVHILLTALAAIVVLLLGFRLIRWLTRVVAKGRFLKKQDATVRTFVQSLLSILLKIVLIITVAGIVGVPTASLVAVLGSAGVAIGLALQGSLSNFAGGAMILLYKPFVAGDFISVPNSESGTVRGISTFYTTIETLDGRVVVLPNGMVSNAAITNYTARPARRVDVSFSVAYGADIEQVKRTVLAAVSTMEQVKAEPAPFVRMTKMADSALNFTCRLWCDTADYWDVFYDATEGIKQALDAAGVAIPFPQLDVHLDRGV